MVSGITITPMAKRQAHGEDFVEIEGIVVHSRPRSGFNPEGVNNSFRRIIDAAAGLDSWILWADVDEGFGLTPESFDTMISWLKEIERHGCVGLAVTKSNPLLEYYADRVAKEVSYPFLISDSNQEIAAFLRNLSGDSSPGSTGDRPDL